MPYLVILSPAIGGLLELAARGRTRGFAALAGVALGFILAAAGCGPAAIAGGTRLATCLGPFALDAMGLAMVLLLTGLGAVGLLAARHHRSPLLDCCSALFVAAGCWAALTDHIFHLFLAVEATTLATVLPVAFHRRPASWDAAYKYLMLNALGLAAGLLGLGVLYGAAGGEWHLTALGSVALDARQAALAGALVITGFGTKAALFPLHAWLPDAYQESPTGFIALFSGTGTKVALVALARLLPPLVSAAPGLQTLLLTLACLTMLLGVALTFAQDDLRRLLAYSSISQMGYIAMGLALGGAGYSAATFHMLSHALLKALLFLCAGWLLERHGTASIAVLADGRRHPAWLGPLFLLGALGLGGVPPLPAFWSKFLIFTAAMDGGQYLAAGVAALTSLLTITTLVRAGSRIFLIQHEAGEKPWASSTH